MNATVDAIWHDVECGSYEADLSLWVELAEGCTGPVLELGCGTGRVSLHLARRGHRVYALDRDPDLLAALRERAADFMHSGVGQESAAPNGAAVVTVEANARQFVLPSQPVGLVLAPMQLLQLLEDSSERIECLEVVASSLGRGGLLAAAIVEDAQSGFNEAGDVLPDTREVDGWVYSSLPLEADVDAERIAIRRLRKVVSPAGDLETSDDVIELRRLDAATLEAEAARAGLHPAGRREVPPTLDHVGSTVVLLERRS